MNQEKCLGGWNGSAELRRQARVLSSGVLGMGGDLELSRIVEQVATETAFPFAAVSIVDKSRLWLAVAYGFDPREFGRPNSFCDAAIKKPRFEPLCVPDAWKEPRFSFAPAVIEMNVRAYYAAPLITDDGLALGTLCLFDQKPRQIDSPALALLSSLASDASKVINRVPNARAYAEFAITELCTRIRFAMSEGDDEAVAVLDQELRRCERSLEPRWQTEG